jgi:hypothetical protein
LSNADRNAVSISELASKHPATALGELIAVVAKKEGNSIVVLIDEYDKPILDFVAHPKKAEEIRVTLQNFYAQIKAADESLRFVFITGISKFSKMGIFSAMNNLIDISMQRRYATMLGYTEEEVASNFGGYIEKIAAARGESEEELLMRMRNYYDGFSFDGTARLYNPFSTLNFFNDPEFRNYWFESGTPSFLMRYMKDKKLTVEQFRGLNVSRDFASAPGEIETATAASFLYQSGYLSLRPGAVDDYTLDYPNHEVLTALSSLLAENILGDRSEAEGSRSVLRQCLADGDAEGVVLEFNHLLAAIPYDDYAGAARSAVRTRRLNMDAGEWLYRSTLLSYLYGMGLDVEAEPHTARGRADMKVKFKGYVWIIELKVARGESETRKAAEGAMTQIVKKGYADRYRGNTVLLALAIDDECRSITQHRVKKEDSGSV